MIKAPSAYKDEDLKLVTEFATVALGALAPMLQDIDLSDTLEVDCLASNIAKACYSMGVCMLEEYEITRSGMAEVNAKLASQEQ